MCTQPLRHTRAAVVPASRATGSCLLRLPPRMTSHPRATLFGTPDYQTLLDQLPRRWSDQVDDAKVAVYDALIMLVCLLEGPWELQWRVPPDHDLELHLAPLLYEGRKQQHHSGLPNLLPSIVECLEHDGLQEVKQLNDWEAQCVSADGVRVLVKVRWGTVTLNTAPRGAVMCGEFKIWYSRLKTRMCMWVGGTGDNAVRHCKRCNTCPACLACRAGGQRPGWPGIRAGS